MPSFNPEMLKQLLDSFVEQEQVLVNEIEVATQQIQNLESQIEDCRQRIDSLDVDRNKILAMKDSYRGGSTKISQADEEEPLAATDKISSPLAAASGSKPEKTATQAKSTASSAAKAANNKSKAENGSTTSAKTQSSASSSKGKEASQSSQDKPAASGAQDSENTKSQAAPAVRKNPITGLPLRAQQPTKPTAAPPVETPALNESSETQAQEEESETPIAPDTTPAATNEEGESPVTESADSEPQEQKHDENQLKNIQEALKNLFK